MDVCIDERGHHQPTGGIDFTRRATVGRKFANDAGKVAVLRGDIHQPIMTVKLCMTDDKIILHMKFLNWARLSPLPQIQSEQQAVVPASFCKSRHRWEVPASSLQINNRAPVQINTPQKLKGPTPENKAQ